MSDIFQTKPLIVKAYQWPGQLSNEPEASNFLRRCGIEIVDVLVVASHGRKAVFEARDIVLMIGRRVMRAQAGDWIVCVSEGCMQVLQDDHFRLMYGPV